MVCMRFVFFITRALAQMGLEGNACPSFHALHIKPNRSNDHTCKIFVNTPGMLLQHGPLQGSITELYRDAVYVVDLLSLHFDSSLAEARQKEYAQSTA